MARAASFLPTLNKSALERLMPGYGDAGIERHHFCVLENGMALFGVDILIATAARQAMTAAKFMRARLKELN